MKRFKYLSKNSNKPRTIYEAPL